MNKELNSTEAVDCILAGYNSTCALVLNKFWCKQQFKIMHQAYIPYLSSPQQPLKCQCPLCGQDRPTLLHILWLCSHIAFFWDQVENLAATVTGCSLTKDIFSLLFANLETVSASNLKAQLAITHHNKAWLSTCFMLAKCTILKKWSSANPLTISDVKKDLTSLLHKEKLDADLSTSGKPSRLQLKWSPFFTKT